MVGTRYSFSYLCKIQLFVSNSLFVYLENKLNQEEYGKYAFESVNCTHILRARGITVQ